MTPNDAVTIEQVDNGFVVRRLNTAQTPALAEDTVVHHDLAALRDWLTAHFGRRECPKCKRLASRADYLLPFSCRQAYMCSRCLTATVAGAEQWITFDPESPDDDLVGRLREMAHALDWPSEHRG
jgi:hypothetical protein